MDFFAAQARARTNTRVLILYFGLALLVIAAGVYGLALLLFTGVMDGSTAASGGFQPLLWWQPGVLVAVLLGVGLVIGGGSLVKIAMLRHSGGAGVAESLGGRRVERDTTEFAERRLLNLVEEMSLAAGMPLPQVYILDHEQGINAFAAGFSPDEAVVAVTRGCLDQFSRDELQAVIGHEMSHIVHGDMALNVRLMGVIFGLLMLWTLGRWMLALAPNRGRGSKNQDSRLAIFGLGVLVLGAIGLFFGRLIQAAASRQREYLADASSVQFTRNPQALQAALLKILQAGSGLQTPAAEQARHFFFADGGGRARKRGDDARSLRSAQGFMGGWLATHPPLVSRIQRLDPHGGAESLARAVDVNGAAAGLGTPNGALASGMTSLPTSVPAKVSASGMQVHGGAALAPGVSSAQAVPASVSALAPSLDADKPAAGGSLLVQSAGQLEAGHLAYVQHLMTQIAPEIQQAAHQPQSAALLVQALFCLSRPDQSNHRMQVLAPPKGLALADWVRLLSALPAQAQLLVFDLALPSLQALPQRLRADLLRQLAELAAPDLDAGLFDLLLLVGVQAGASAHADLVSIASDPVDSIVDNSIGKGAAMNLVFSCLARAAGTGADVERAFAAACAQAPEPYAWRLLAGTGLRPGALIGAGRRLARLRPERKRALLAACEAAVVENASIRLAEGQLLRVICALLGVPMPLLLPGQLRHFAEVNQGR
ncbi:M48 family metallopeptidase [Thiorhodovibrio frisius]|uniref:Zn-dependent protease with chaperone function n=1 Tax=Thiorhodovibrio frisius TaxID=631362 RepID=H8Z680_9GAMM|nr:M48 family metallopeptidase [Thiorhodovibrio frisius]EIC19647.1 Zn-dependent protease with chaperone function [Thiorhodovibrio frisius]WPL20386.1 HtpX protein [Thiorhodovibrio frisius]